MRLAQRAVLFVAVAVLVALALAPAAEACTQACIRVSPGCRVCEDVGYFTGAACHGGGSGCYCVYDPVICKAPAMGGSAEPVAPAAWIDEENKPAPAVCTEEQGLPQAQPTA